MNDTQFAVTLFDRERGESTAIPCEDEQEARTLADTFRPTCGASYVHDQDRALVFKAPRRPARPRYSTRRLSAAQVEAAAKRFENDGEHENAANMRGLLT